MIEFIEVHSAMSSTDRRGMRRTHAQVVGYGEWLAHIMEKACPALDPG
jgi:hypothetical protein